MGGGIREIGRGKSVKGEKKKKEGPQQINRVKGSTRRTKFQRPLDGSEEPER